MPATDALLAWLHADSRTALNLPLCAVEDARCAAMGVQSGTDCGQAGPGPHDGVVAKPFHVSSPREP
jgi:hypothetical protein